MGRSHVFLGEGQQFSGALAQLLVRISAHLVLHGWSFVTCVCVCKLPETCHRPAHSGRIGFAVLDHHTSTSRAAMAAAEMDGTAAVTPHAELATNMSLENQHVAHAGKKSFKPSHMLGEDDPTD